jgi:sugar lactone lactonase YvrE
MKIIRYNFWICLIVFLFTIIFAGMAVSQERYDFSTKWGSPGSGNSQFNKPYGIAVGSSGNIYVADYLNCRIQKFSSAGSYITQWGSLGTGDEQFGCPNDIALDSSENVYVTDECNHRVQKFNSGGTYTAQWGAQGAGDGQFNYPTGIAIDSSNKVYVVDKDNSRIQVFTSAGVFSSKWGSQGSGGGQLSYPLGIAIDTSGNVYVADTGNYRIQKYSSTGTFLGTWGSPGTGEGQFNNIQKVAVDSAGYVYATDGSNIRIQKFSSAGNFLYKWGSSGSDSGQFSSPFGIAVNSAGDVYVGDASNNNIQKFSHYCVNTISPSSSALNAFSNTGTIGISTSPNSCTWTATSGSSWITVTGGASGSGTGTVSYSITANDNIARSGTITIGGQTFTVSQAGWIYSNSIGSNNSIKITDLSGSLSSSGATITVKAWDVNGNVLTESESADALKLYNNGTTIVSGTDLANRFPTGGTPLLYGLTAGSAKIVITNVKISTDGTLNIPNGYTTGTTNFITNSVGARNSIKITDMSGSLSSSGAAITVSAWDVNGIVIPESGTAAPLKIYSHGTTAITGLDLAARFPSGTPMSYEFTVNSSKVVITNVKSSSDGTINIPYSFTNGTTNFAANSIGLRNTVKITDMSGTLSLSGEAVTVSAWDVDGNAIDESGTAVPLKLYSHRTITLTGRELADRFPGATPMSYEFAVNSSKYIITNIKSSNDGSINIPSVYTSGTTKYATNYAGSRNTIKITDMTGNISPSGNDISIAAWDVDGNPIDESGTATPLKIYSYGTTTIPGSTLATRFPTGTPAVYEFTIWSVKFIVTDLTANTDGAINVPSVYISGVAGGI